MRVSCKKLHETLRAFGYGYTYKSIKDSCETYGRDTRAYLPTMTAKDRKYLEDVLTANNISFNRSYAPGQNVVEVMVTYLKAYGWDE